MYSPSRYRGVVATRQQRDRTFTVDFTPLHAKRVLSHLTRDDVAKAVGVNWVTIWRWEKNRYTPNVEDLVALSRALGTPMEELFRVVEAGP